MSEIDADKESWVRRRAYQLWQERGEAHGQHDDHWHEAEREYDKVMGAPADASTTDTDLEQDLIETPPPVPDADNSTEHLVPSAAPAANTDHTRGSTTSGSAPTAEDLPPSV
jgi:hypothetical protein